MNRTTLASIVAIIFTVGVLGAPQWYQNEPYAYSSYDDISTAQTYENLGEGTSETHENSEMEPSTDWSETPEGSESYDAQGYQTHENSEMEPSTYWSETQDGSQIYDTQAYDQPEENSVMEPSTDWSETQYGSQTYETQDYEPPQDNSVMEPSTDWAETQDGSQTYHTQDYEPPQGNSVMEPSTDWAETQGDSETEPLPDYPDTPKGSESSDTQDYGEPQENSAMDPSTDWTETQGDSEMEPSPDYPDTPNGSESSDLEENQPQDDYGNSSDSTGDVDNQENTIEETFCGFKPEEGHDDEFRERGHKFENEIVRYKISQYSEVISDYDVDDILVQAFGTWSKVVDLKFHKVDYMDQADIDIRFAAYDHGCGSAFDGPSKVLAHATMNYVHFDDSENWSREVGGHVTNLYAIAVHEIGHSLGLSHSDDHDAIMYPQYFRKNPTVKLGTDDIEGIQKIYGRKKASIRPRPRPRLMRPTEPPMEPMEPPMPPANTCFSYNLQLYYG